MRVPSNLFDGFIVAVSIIDLAGDSFKFKINIIRLLRILRVIRILRPLEYMKFITKVIVNKFFSFIYICFLLIILMIIYTFIGQQIFGGHLDNNKYGIRQTFDTFYFGFLSVFQLVSMENWNDIGALCLKSDIPIPFTIFYVFSLVFFGNYVFLNLFLGVLLEGFSNITKEDEDEENSQEIIFIRNSPKASRLNSTAESIGDSEVLPSSYFKKKKFLMKILGIMNIVKSLCGFLTRKIALEELAL